MLILKNSGTGGCGCTVEEVEVTTLDQFCQLEAFERPKTTAELQHNNNLINALIKAFCCLAENIADIEVKKRVSVVGFSGSAYVLTDSEIESIGFPITTASSVNAYYNGQLMNPGRAIIDSDSSVSFLNNDGDAAAEFMNCSITLEFCFPLEIKLDC